MKKKYEIPELQMLQLMLKDVILYSVGKEEETLNKEEETSPFDALFDANGGINTP